MKTFLFILAIGFAILPPDSRVYTGFIAGVVVVLNYMFFYDLYKLMTDKSDAEGQP